MRCQIIWGMLSRQAMRIHVLYLLDEFSSEDVAASKDSGPRTERHSAGWSVRLWHSFLTVLRNTVGSCVFCCLQLLPTNCSAVKQLPQFCKHSKSADLLRKSLLSHVWRVPSSKALSCKHERLFDLLTLASSYYRKTDRRSEGRNFRQKPKKR